MQLRVRQVGAQLAQPFPRVLIQKAQAGVERGAAPAFEGIVPDRVENFAGGEHLLERHARGGLRLVRVAQDGVGDEKGLVR